MTSVINPAAEPEPAASSPVDGSAEAGSAGSVAAPALGWSGAEPPPYEVPPPGRFGAFILRLRARSPRWLAPAAVLACFAGAGAYVLATDPTDGVADAAPTCIVKLTTGFDCPGCGGTRAFWYVLNGNLPAAARHHLIFVFALPFLVYAYVAWAGQRVFGRRLPALRLSPVMVGVFIGAWVAFTIIRNLPWAPFTWLYV
ncbi:MAG TPA: DUF2752 domain-containing protein [Pilimelia sp.]|nr:DUF2752 domain-containing protein [Pilimelia sp.]